MMTIYIVQHRETEENLQRILQGSYNKTNMNRYSIIKIVESGTSCIYRLENSETTNEYYVVSSPEAIELIVNPETVGYTCQHCLLQSTQTVMQFLLGKEPISRPHIFNILRGGLNFPLEEACFNISMKVCSTDFVSCERVIENGVIKGLDIRYEKIIAEKDVTLLMQADTCERLEQTASASILMSRSGLRYRLSSPTICSMRS